MLVATPIGAVLLTMIVGADHFRAIGYDGPRAVYQIFFTPIARLLQMAGRGARRPRRSSSSRSAFRIGNQAKIWNIGAEGQYLVGALARRGRRRS